MYISELIEHLEQYRKEYGDIKVLAKNEVGSISDFGYDDLYVDTDHKDGSVTLEFDV